MGFLTGHVPGPSLYCATTGQKLQPASQEQLAAWKKQGSQGTMDVGWHGTTRKVYIK